jgi:hypothetical protein
LQKSVTLAEAGARQLGRLIAQARCLADELFVEDRAITQ